MDQAIQRKIKSTSKEETKIVWQEEGERLVPFSYHGMYHSKKIIDNNPIEKLEAIFKFLIQSVKDNLPNDILSEEGTDTMNRDKIKSTMIRFKTNITKNAKRSIIV